MVYSRPMSDPIDLVRARLRDVPDFPKPGILFKDITPVLGDAAAFSAALDALAAYAAPLGVTRVLGVEARGFILGAALAARMGLGFVPARKPGKLPAAVDRASYALEYGADSLEMHVGSFTPGERVLLVDDVIATGGTAAAAIALAHMQGAVVAGAAFLIELSFLGAKLPAGTDVFAALTY
jgi:adenine phosphoribosyltransferase